MGSEIRGAESSERRAQILGSERARIQPNSNSKVDVAQQCRYILLHLGTFGSRSAGPAQNVELDSHPHPIHHSARST